jgi:hypothetical protein
MPWLAAVTMATGCAFDIMCFPSQWSHPWLTDLATGLEVRNRLFGEERTQQSFVNQDPTIRISSAL